eukprot:331578_1
MGKCISQNRREQAANTDEPHLIEEDSDPSLWSQQQVLSWLSTIDLNIQPDEKLKLYKKFKKNKIDGNKLTQLTEIKLKQKLKINAIGLRLELMKVINNKKSCQGYPSPLYHNKYQLPQYYPCDYKYRIHIDLSSQNQSPKSSKSKPNINDSNQPINTYIHSTAVHNKDRLSWTIGTIILLNLFDYQTWCAAQIIETCKSQDAFLFGIDERLTDYVTVIYDLGNGIFDSKKVCRFDRKQIKSDERFLRNRWKLQKNCMVEIFNPSLNQWIHSYIKSFGSNNKNHFNIANCNIQNQNRWHPQIRCSEALLNLNLNSELHIFKFDEFKDNLSKTACCAKIKEIYNHEYLGNIYKNNKIQKLDIFKVIYKTPNNKYYYKYIHQFSANILLLNTDIDRPATDYTDLEVAMYSNVIEPDPNDEFHIQLLIEGWLRRKFRKYRMDYQADLVQLMNECSYHTGPNYGLIMYLESKYWS